MLQHLERPCACQYHLCLRMSPQLRLWTHLNIDRMRSFPWVWSVAYCIPIYAGRGFDASLTDSLRRPDQLNSHSCVSAQINYFIQSPERPCIMLAASGSHLSSQLGSLQTSERSTILTRPRMIKMTVLHLKDLRFGLTILIGISPR